MESAWLWKEETVAMTAHQVAGDCSGGSAGWHRPAATEEIGISLQGVKCNITRSGRMGSGLALPHALPTFDRHTFTSTRWAKTPWFNLVLKTYFTLHLSGVVVVLSSLCVESKSTNEENHKSLPTKPFHRHSCCPCSVHLALSSEELS